MELPHIGEHCSEKSCNRLDFLILKCDACEAIFCTDHISYDGHACPSSYKKDVQVPTCPLCNVPIPSKRGDPPDLAVGLHMDNDCKIDVKNRKKVFSNRCSHKGCKTKEIVPINCSDCRQNYCLKHRHPADHDCMGKDSVRQKRLNALSRSNNTNDGNSQKFRNLQGTISEDEALARALQASQEETYKNQTEQPSASWNSTKGKCRLS